MTDYNGNEIIIGRYVAYRSGSLLNDFKFLGKVVGPAWHVGLETINDLVRIRIEMGDECINAVGLIIEKFTHNIKMISDDEAMLMLLEGK